MGRGLVGVRRLMDELRDRRARPSAARGSSCRKRIPPGAPVADARAVRDELARRARAQPVRRGHAPERGAAAGARRGPRAPGRSCCALNRELEEHQPRRRGALRRARRPRRAPARRRRAQVALPGRHEPRAAHAAELDRRADRAAARRRAAARGRAGDPGRLHPPRWPRSSSGSSATCSTSPRSRPAGVERRSRRRLRRRAVQPGPARQLRPLVREAERRAALRRRARPAHAAHRRGQARAGPAQPRLQRAQVHARRRDRGRAPTPDDGVVRFSVRDTGIGIAPADLDADLRRVRADPRRAAAQRPGHRPRPAAVHAARRAARAAGSRRHEPRSARARRSTCRFRAADQVAVPAAVPDPYRRPCSSSTTTSRRATSCDAHLRGAGWPVTEVASGDRPRWRRCERERPRGDRARPVDARHRRDRRPRPPARGRADARDPDRRAHFTRAERRRARADRGAWRPDPRQVDHLARRRCAPPSPRRSRTAWPLRPRSSSPTTTTSAATSIATMLRRAGFAVREAIDGVQAVDRGAPRPAGPRGARREDARLRRLRGVPAAQGRPGDAARAGAAALRHVPRHRRTRSRDSRPGPTAISRSRSRRRCSPRPCGRCCARGGAEAEVREAARQWRTTFDAIARRRRRRRRGRGDRARERRVRHALRT